MEGDLCATVLMLTFLAIFLGGVFIAEEFELRVSRIWIGVAIAVPHITAVVTMAYVYALTKKLGGDPCAIKNSADM